MDIQLYLNPILRILKAMKSQPSFYDLKRFPRKVSILIH